MKFSGRPHRNEDEIKKPTENLPSSITRQNPGTKRLRRNSRKSQALEVLKDRDKRRKYDQFGHDAFRVGGCFGRSRPFDLFRDAFGGGGGGGGGFGSIFEDFFGGGSASGGMEQRGADLRVPSKLPRASGIRRRKGDQVSTSRECSLFWSGAASGSGKIMCSTCGGVGQVASNQGFISIRRTCPTCAGSGIMIENPCAECKGEGRKRSPTKIKVNVPKGVGDGNRLCSRGRGDAGPRGGPSGDLYVGVRIKSHEFLVRDEDDLFHEMMIPFTLATRRSGSVLL